MAKGLGGGGWLGIGFESVAGTYVAPTKFIPILSEDLQRIEDKVYRNPIRQLVDPVGVVQGHYHIEGGISAEVLSDTILYLLYGARMTVAKTGSGPYTYTFSPSAAATPPNKYLSITVQRADQKFGYAGCAVGSLEFSFSDGILNVAVGIQGMGEGTASGTPSWPTTVPFGPDDTTIEVDTSERTDFEDLSISFNDNAEVWTTIDGNREATNVKFGEREISGSASIEFDALTDYNAFKAATGMRLELLANQDANNQVTVDLKNIVFDTYPVNLSSIGDIIKAEADLRALYDATATKAFEIVVVSQENIT